MIEISIIIPTYGRPAALKNCLEALALCDFPPDEFEVIVVDDGSPDPVALRLDDLARTINVTVVRQENKGQGAARNLAVTHARGNYLAFTDDDCLPEAGWLRALRDRLVRGGHCAVGGRTINAVPRNVYARVHHLLSNKAYWRYETDPSKILFLIGNNFALAREWFERESGYNENVWPGYEDRELCDRLVRSGYRLIYAPEAVVAHNRTLTLPSFVAQHMGYGRGAFKYYRQYRGTAKQGERLFFFRTMGEAARESSGLDKLWAPTLVVLSQLAAFTGMILEAIASRTGARSAP